MAAATMASAGLKVLKSTMTVAATVAMVVFVPVVTTVVTTTASTAVTIVASVTASVVYSVMSGSVAAANVFLPSRRAVTDAAAAADAAEVPECAADSSSH